MMLYKPNNGNKIVKNSTFRNEGGKPNHDYCYQSCIFIDVPLNLLDSNVFENCTFIRCSFTNGINNIWFMSCVFEQCNFYIQFGNDYFYDCRFTAIEASYLSFHACMVELCVFTCNMKNVSFTNTSTEACDFSGCTDMFSPSEFLQNNFEWTDKGIIAYKVFNLYRPHPNYWKIEKGASIQEAGNFNNTDECGSGVNVATLQWIQNYAPFHTQWQVLIPPKSIPNIIVPFCSDGKIRVINAPVILLDTIERTSFSMENRFS